jgi:hypothetical protein
VSNNVEFSPEKIPMADEIAGHISRVFDSVNFCNEHIRAGVKNEHIKERVKANMDHITGMLTREWILDNLTEQENAEINSTIAASEAFIYSH